MMYNRILEVPYVEPKAQPQTKTDAGVMDLSRRQRMACINDESTLQKRHMNQDYLQFVPHRLIPRTTARQQMKCRVA